LILLVTDASVLVAPAGPAVAAPSTNTARTSARLVTNATTRCEGRATVLDTGLNPIKVG
jgi:hypothetical protein